jgi:hypothetical protein
VAVFWNPSQVSVMQRRYEVSVMDLRAPGMTGVSGVAIAGSARLDERTVIALGYERIGVDDIEQTTTSPDVEATLDVSEHRFAAGASHALGARLHVGAGVQYTRLPEVSAQASVLALTGGVRLRPMLHVPLILAVMAATEGEDERWLAGVEIASDERWDELTLRAQYGAAGGELAPGVTHRLTATAEWRGIAEVTAGALREPNGDDHSIQPVVGASVGLHRYRLGLVRESLPNDFGAAYSLRFSVGFQEP